MSISNNVSSLQTNQQFLSTTAQSIKNHSGELTKDIPNLIVSEKVNAIDVTAIKVQDEMLGSLLDIKA